MSAGQSAASGTEGEQLSTHCPLQRSPLHEQLAAALRAQIAAGDIEVGALLPSEKALAAEHGVSRHTVRHAIADLVASGLVGIRRGKGSFVLTGPARRAAPKVGVLLAHLNGWFGMEALGGMERIIRAAGHEMSVRTTDDPERGDGGQAMAALQMREAGADGLVVEPAAWGPGDERFFSALWQEGFPVVFIDRFVPGCPLPWVASDNFGGALELGRHLLGLGHRRFVFLPPHEPGLVVSEQRREGLRAALAGMPGHTCLLAETAPVRGQPHSVRRAIESCLAGAADRWPTAIVCGADYIAAEALFVLRDMGVAVPGTVTVTGFDGMPYSAWLDPPLTTVRQHPRAMGEAAAALLVDMLSRPRDVRDGGRNVLLPAELEVRASSGPPPARGVSSLTEAPPLWAMSGA